MKKILYCIGFLLTALCLWLFASRFMLHWHTLQKIRPDAQLIGWLATATIAYLATHALAANAWRSALLLCGQCLPALTCIRISMVTQFAKFLPGNVGQHIGRVMLTMRAGASGKAATASILLDMGILCLVASSMSLLNLDTALTVLTPYRAALIWLVPAVSAVALMSAVIACKYWPERIAASLQLLSTQFSRLQQQGLRSLLRILLEAIVSHAASFSLGAVALACILAGISGTSLPPAHLILGAFVAAWLLGFVIPGSPAGIGIRELVLVLSLDRQSASRLLFSQPRSYA